MAKELRYYGCCHPCLYFYLQVICEFLIDAAYTCGIRVVDQIDPEEYREFLDNQREIVTEQKADLKAAREAKLLRTL